MIRVEQQAKDDCLRACVASLFESHLSDVPNFVPLHMEKYPSELASWLGRFGMYPLFLHADLIEGGGPPGYSIMIGETRTGGHHAVVSLDGHEVWNPDPGGNRIKKVDQFLIFASKDPGRRRGEA